MDNVKQHKMVFPNTSYFLNKVYNVPKKCPHCLHSISVTVLDAKQQNYDSLHHMNFLLHKCPECEKGFMTVHLRIVKSGSNELLYCYPSNIVHKHSKLIENFSPRFVEVYNQAYMAEQMNHITLAGSGYRIALEIIVKDFAIIANPQDEEKIRNNITLNNCIQEYYKDIETLVPAHVVRKLGNDFSHYNKKFEEVDFKEIKTYLDIFVLNIEMKLKIIDPPVPV